MKLIDEKFKDEKLRYILQCFVAMMSIFAILFLFDKVLNAIIVAALGSSTFIVFTMPKANVSKPRFLIGGYFIGTVMGLYCDYLQYLPYFGQLSFVQEHSHAIFGALAVGMAIFAMVVTDTEHPPAAGMALALVLDEWTYLAIAVTIGGIIILSLMRHLFRRFLHNLL